MNDMVVKAGQRDLAEVQAREEVGKGTHLIYIMFKYFHLKKKCTTGRKFYIA